MKKPLIIVFVTVALLSCKSDPSSSSEGGVATGSLTGVVEAAMGFAPEVPVAGATIVLTTESGERLTTTSAANGSYTIQSIPEGLHSYSAYAIGYDTTTFGKIWHADESVMTDFRLQGRCTINGTVVDDGTGAPFQPFGTVETYYLGVRVTSDFTDASGTYVVDNLAPLSYRLVAKHFGNDSDSSDVTAGTTPVTVNFRLK